MKKQTTDKETDPKIYALVVVSLLSSIAAVLFGILNAVGVPELFHNSIAYLSAKYFNEATPAGFVFATIWPIIYAFILAGSIYLLVSIFLPSNQSPVNHDPTLTSQSFLIASSLGCLATVIWLFAFDREMLVPSFAVLLIGSCSLWVAVSSSLTVVYNNLEQLEEYSRTMLLTVRILIHNALTLFATWATTATVLGFTIALIYVDSPGMNEAQLRGIVNVEDGSTIALAVLFVIIVVLFVLENFVFEAYFRYVFTIFPVFILALTGIVVQLSENSADRNLQIAAIELAICVVCEIFRIVVTIIKLTNPQPSNYYPKKNSGKAALLDEEY